MDKIFGNYNDIYKLIPSKTVKVKDFDGNAPISIKKEMINAEKVNTIQTKL
jgi:hypothetical protein